MTFLGVGVRTVQHGLITRRGRYCSARAPYRVGRGLQHSLITRFDNSLVYIPL